MGSSYCQDSSSAFLTPIHVHIHFQSAKHRQIGAPGQADARQCGCFAVPHCAMLNTLPGKIASPRTLTVLSRDVNLLRDTMLG